MDLEKQMTKDNTDIDKTIENKTNEEIAATLEVYSDTSNETKFNLYKNKFLNLIKDIKLKDNTIQNKEKLSNLKKKLFINVKAYSLKIIAITTIFTAITITCGFIQKNAQKVLVDGVEVAITSNQKITNSEILEKAVEKLKNDTGINVEVNEEVTLVPVHASSDEISSDDDVIDKVASSFTYQVEAVSIYIDGKKMATVSSRSEALEVIDKIKALYNNSTDIIECSFVEEIGFKSEYVNSKDIIAKDKAYDILTESVAVQKKYTIKEGDTLWSIAQNSGIKLDELLKINPDITEDSILSLDSEINLTAYIPRVSVKTIKEIKYTDTIPKETITVENENEYKTYKEVLEEGADGEKTITAKITSINGIEENREVIKEEVTKQSIPQKIEIGTMQTPPKKALGSFKYPVYGTLSSGFGSRWGRTHKGLDLAAPYGTPICASDGGTVTFAGWNNGGYGYLVTIDHGNGYETYYAHNSSLAVSVGDKVYQGEVIAYVGSTGDSTGNHVHFEIRQNGSPVNPLNFL